ncbi:MAG: ATP-dependent DNA helicase DinG, partial [Stenotrophomonas sp.]
MTEKVEAPRALNDELKTVIRDAYTKLQANTPGFSTRRSQSQMIGVVSRALSHSGGVGVVEAPTGVGKSLGYLTAGVPIALATKKKLVISTGTVALQSQLVERDIPNFLKATGIEATVALAKGRTRYLCTRNAAEAHGDGAQEGMFEDEQPLFDRPLAPIEMDLAQKLSKDFVEGRWNGDLDNAPDTISASLRSRITTPASGCAGRKCAYSAQCAVLRARNNVRDAQIVVTNHALLLSALSIGESDNGQPLIAPPSDMLLVLDEGHHIGNVAIDQGAASLALDEMAKRTGRLQILIAAAYRAVDKDKLGNLLPNEAIDVAARVSKQLRAFRDVIDRSWQPDPTAQEPMWRAPNGRLPDIWMADIEALADDTRALFNWAHAAQSQVAKGKPEDAARERLQRTLGMALEMIEQQHSLWTAWRREDKEGQPPFARWVTLSRDGDLILHGSPVSAANVLRKLLWDEVDSVVMTSATLTGGGDFQALAIDNGIPAEAEMVSLASPFDLPNQAELIVPNFPVTPDDRDRHPKEVAKYLVKELDWSKGSIVLFTSRWKMEKVAELMPAAQRKQVLVQGETAKQKMIDEHLRRTSA